MKRRSFLAAVPLAVAGSSLVPAVASAASVALPQGARLKSLTVVPSSGLAGHADGVMVACLQGLVAKSSGDQIFIDEGGPGADWKNDLATTYGIELVTSSDVLTRFRKYVRGYVLYDYATNPHSVNVATSLSGPLHALPVDKTQEAPVRALGIKKVLDVSARDEKWAYSNYRSLFSTTVAAELNPEISYHLRDYATLTNAFTFYDGVTEWRRTILSGMAAGATLMGYGNSELDMVQQASEEGVTSIPSDVAPNLAALSAVRSTAGLVQKPQRRRASGNKHYVSFVISDGDNVAYNLWSMKDYRDKPDRGFSNLGYGISPSLVDLAPSAMRLYYREALRGVTNEDFIASASGTGYTYPSRMPPAELDRYVTRMNRYLGAADLGIVEILENQNVFDRGDLWTKFLRQPNADALFYFGPDAAGGINWYGGKPVVAQRDVLWQGLTEEPQLIDNINSRPAAPTSADGYTLVLVHVWTKDLAAIKTVVQGLNPDVEVVTPTELVRLIKENKAR